MIKVEQEVLKITDATRILGVDSVQSLWSGYGEIKRFHLEGGDYPSVIVKHIQLPTVTNHPRGWNTDISHQRKLKSYQIESNWYQHYAASTTDQCRVPQMLHTHDGGSELLLIMEDLDASGYSSRLTPGRVSLDDIKIGLGWLAHFHAQFMEDKGDGLWPIGTYWHLDTRPDEWSRMENTSLKNAAKAIDHELNNARYQTLVHGDAKLANFCFGAEGKVAAVDFQYVGRGCGMKDVAYFISSCLHESDCERYEEVLLKHYFSILEIGLNNDFDFQLVKKEWIRLYGYAWADFYRFLDGWSPGHWKMHGYSERIAARVISELNR